MVVSAGRAQKARFALVCALVALGGRDAWALDPNVPLSLCPPGSVEVRGTGSSTYEVAAVAMTDGNASAIAGCGFLVDRVPQLCIVAERAGTWTMTVERSDSDDSTLTLLEARGARSWCDDDSAGQLRPRLEVALEQGSVYLLFVGTPVAPGPLRATIQVSGARQAP
jgi:hypothetical protein